MKKIICLMCATALLSSCHIYKSYDRPEDITTAGLYRDTASVNDTLAADTANFGNLPWREVFTDPQLQTLIEQALTNNGDLRSAALNVKQAQAALMSARLAYAPTLALSPQGTVSSWDKGKATQIYSLPVTASWQIDLFGQLLNPKRQAKVSLKQTQFYEQAVQTQVIAGVANMYLNVKQAQAALMSARLAYAPTLALSPQGTVSSWDKGKATQIYSLPVTASWQIDLFGQLLNPKRQAKVSLKQTQFYEQAVQTQVIAGVANMYYTLLMLDRQLQITEGTVEILKKNLETVQAMKDAGIYGTTSAAVEQSRTAYAQVMASLPDIRQSIRETENALCLMLHQPAQSIARGVLEEQQLPTEFSVGIPLQLLSNRPDVKAAEMSLAANYYNTNSARAAFYPQITLSGSGGWTNNSGAGIVNPGKLLASAIGSLTQPLFYRGANIARLKQAKAQEEQAKIQFQTALLNAGNEVSNALHLYQMEKDKAVSRTIQVNSARQAASDTKELFNLGTSTYLEVLSAEQSYLSAQLAEVSDTFSSMQAVISLYQALGGGRE